MGDRRCFLANLGELRGEGHGDERGELRGDGRGRTEVDMLARLNREVRLKA